MSDAAKSMTLPSGGTSLMGRIKSYGIWIVAGIALLILPLIFPSGTSLTTMSLMAIMIVFALSYNMLLGQTGMLSFGHAVYYGLAAFVTAHAMNTIIRNGIPIPLPLVPVFGAMAGLVFGIIFGSVSTRRGGTAFAMISLGLAELVASSSLVLRSFFGGEEGISTNRTKLLNLFGWNFGPQIQVYYVIAAWCLLCVILMYAITRTPLGRMCNAVRENPERAEFIGYNTTMVRFIAFSLAGLFAGVAGALATLNFELVTAGEVGAQRSGTVLLAAYLGGVGFFVGPILGAISVTLLQLKLSDYTEIWQLYFGLLFIGMIMFAPGGLAGLMMIHAPLWRARTLHKVIPAYLIALVPVVLLMIGLTLLIELTHHVALKSAEGATMHFLRFDLNTRSLWPWLAAIVLIGGSYYLFRLTWPILGRAWNNALSGGSARAKP